MKRLIEFILFCIGLILFGGASAQNFSYSVSTDSVAWNELNSQTILNSGNTAWNFSYKIPIGFSFNYLGRNFDSLTIETNGYLVFDADRNYAFTAFSNLGDRIDESGNHAVLGYESSGSNGNHILKIQYKNAGESMHEEGSQTWQIWIRENGNIVEVHVGPGTPGDDPGFSCRIGLLNQNMDTETRGFFLGGNASAPSGYPVNDESPDCAVMNYFPAEGYRYTFTTDNN